MTRTTLAATAATIAWLALAPAAVAQVADPLSPAQPKPPQPVIDEPATPPVDLAPEPVAGEVKQGGVQKLPDISYQPISGPQPVAAPDDRLATASGPRVARDWKAIFAAIDGKNWGGARAAIDAMPDHPLKPFAYAELYTAGGSPRVELDPIVRLLQVAPDLPQGTQLQRLAGKRGAVPAPPVATARNLVWLGSAARRQPMKPVIGDPVADANRGQMLGFQKADDAIGAEALLTSLAGQLGPAARGEYAQRTAFIYYVLGRDADARRVIDSFAMGTTGAWGGEAQWIGALAAWRMGDCARAYRGFLDAARETEDREVRAGSYYWAGRSAQACRRPAEVEPLMKRAAEMSDSFYSLVARETLGLSTTLGGRRIASGTAAIEGRENVKRARAALGIGRADLADRLLRHQAKIGPASEHTALVQLASDLNLPQTQYYLAHNGPSGVTVPASARFPLPDYRPAGGWRVDPAVVLAKARQESEFRPSVISPDGAVGLMQLLPSTASGFARQLGRSVSAADLTDPAINIDYGQIYIEKVKRMQATGGTLPKIIASFNAGPLPVGRWAAINDRGGDPILWMESLPYWETRLYVPSVMRNVWVYQGLRGTSQQSLRDVAEHRFPQLPANSAR